MYIYLPWQYLSYAEAHPVLRKAKNIIIFLKKNQQDKHWIQFVCSESIHVTCLIVQIVTLTLIMHWSKIV